MTAKLLIVDDDTNSVRLMNEVLRGMGDLFFATNGAAAIRFAKEHKPDIVLLDAEMPEMDGFGVCAALKADPETAESTVIFVTAHSDIEHETRALEMGAMDFVTKPISPPIVRARVRNHLILKAQADQLRRFASIDHLTMLPNRRVFDETIDQEWRRARRNAQSLALLMVDVDHFKLFNDFYGHPAGDACLHTVAQTLRNNIRRPGENVARYGGEEFVILLPDTPEQGALKLANSLCSEVRDLKIPHEKSPTFEFVTISIGVSALVPGDDTNFAVLVEAADQALYEAKSSGRNQVAAKASLI